MKNYLAIDTASKHLSVVAFVGGKVYSRFIADCAMKQSTLFMPTVDEVLKEANAKVSDFDFFAVVVGAGSFTGIRIGISAVKGLALATKKPILPITTFEVAEYNTKSVFKKIALVDALHDAYFAELFENGISVEEAKYLKKAEVEEKIKDGFVPVSADSIILSVPVEKVDPLSGLISAVSELSKTNDNFREPVALYVRKSQAELNLSLDGVTAQKGEV